MEDNEKEVTNLDTLNVYDRLNYKAKNSIFELDSEERERLEDMLIENLSDKITKITDEELMAWSNDESLFL